MDGAQRPRCPIADRNGVGPSEDIEDVACGVFGVNGESEAKRRRVVGTVCPSTHRNLSVDAGQPCADVQKIC